MKFTAILVLFTIILSNHIYSQDQVFPFTVMPHSVSSFGTGWQGVASQTSDDAMVYNPAKLTLTDNTKLSFYQNPFNVSGMGPFPFINFTIARSVDKVGSFGISYEDWDWGKFIYTNENAETLGEFDSYDRSFSIAFARELSENLSGGMQLRYAYSNFEPQDNPGGVFLSLGILYNPAILDSKLELGLSILNLGPAVKYEFEDHTNYSPGPSTLSIGANYIAVENDFFSLPLDLSISKPFDEIDDEGNGQSSFKTLFTDWQDFPNDAALHTGLSFMWKPLNLGKDITFIQQFFIGNYSSGIKTHLYNYYTQGANIGVGYKGVNFTAGYAGIFHNVHFPNYMPWVFPYETFQFSLELNNDIFAGVRNDSEADNELEQIVISAGAGQVFRTGRSKTYSILSVENSPIFSVEAAFYFNSRNALISSLQYNSMPLNFNLTFITGSQQYSLSTKTKTETFSFFSSYRYHPIEAFEKMYIQAGLGLHRMNPVQKSEYLKYSYSGIFQLSTGLLVDFIQPLIFIPQVELNSIILPGGNDAPRILGSNQFNLLLKIGYNLL